MFVLGKYGVDSHRSEQVRDYENRLEETELQALHQTDSLLKVAGVRASVAPGVITIAVTVGIVSYFEVVLRNVQVLFKKRPKYLD